MKKKLLNSMRVLLVAAGLGVGASAWATDVASYDFNSQTTPFTIYDSNRIGVTYEEHVADGGDYYAKYKCNNVNGKAFAYYNFASSVTDAATVTVEFDFYFNSGSWQSFISLADADYHVASVLGKGNVSYDTTGAIFNLGQNRAKVSGKNEDHFGINSTHVSALDASCLNTWCHVSVTVDNANRTVSYTIKNSDQTITLKSESNISFLSATAQRCSQIDIYLGNNTDNFVYIDNLVITKTVSATSHTYTINAVAGGTTLNTLATSTATEGALYSTYIPYVVSKDSKYYKLDDAENTNLNGYYASYTMLAADATKEINYSLIEDVVFYGEAEDICTAHSNGKTSSNVSGLSKGGGKYAQAKSGYVTLTFNVPSAGIYDIKVGMNNTNGSNRSFTYQVDSETTSDTITVNANTAHVEEINDQYLTAGNHTIKLSITYSLTPVFDYVLVTSDYVFTEVVGAIDFTTTDRAKESSDITMKPGDVYNVKFCNYGSDGANKNNFCVVINDAASMYADWWDYMQGKGGWAADGGFVNPTLSVTNPYQVSTDGGSTSGNTDWSTWADIRKSFVDLTIKYIDGKVTIEGNATSIDTPNNIFYYGYAYTVADATADATVNLSVCYSWLGIVSVEKTYAGATLGTNGYATFASPYALDLTTANLPDGLTAYKAAVSGTTVTFSPIDQTVPANTGVLLQGEASETYSIPVVASGTTVENNEFLVNTAGTTFEADDDYYYFGLIKNTLTFGQFAPGTVAIPSDKAYLKVLKSSIDGLSSRELTITFGDETMGVQQVLGSEQNVNGYYNLSGQRVAQPTRGLYIVNGKKVILK